MDNKERAKARRNISEFFKAIRYANKKMDMNSRDEAIEEVNRLLIEASKGSGIAILSYKKGI
jgi:hypothetical protein